MNKAKNRCPYGGCQERLPSDRHMLACRARQCRELGIPATNAGRERQLVAKRRARRGLPPIIDVVVESASFAPLPDRHEEEE